MATITSKSDLAGKDDQVVKVAGVYAVQDLGRYKIVSTLPDGTEVQSSKLSYLVLDDKSELRLGARPQDELGLAGTRVVATGTYTSAWPKPQDPKVAQPNAKPTLIQITAVVPESP